MNKFQSIKAKLDPDVVKKIVNSCPIYKKRSAYYHFTVDVKEAARRRARGEEDPAESAFPELPKRLNSRFLSAYWHKMSPNARLKYFIKEQTESMVLKEKKQLWLAQAGTLLKESSDGTKNAQSDTLDQISTMDDLTSTMDEYRKEYEHKIQAESAKQLYQHILQSAEKLNFKVDAKKISSSLPADLQPILECPRKPATPYVLYFQTHLQRLAEEKRTKKLTQSLAELASSEWGALEQHERVKYVARYEGLVKEYEEAQMKFKTKNSSEGRNYLDLANQDHRAYTKDLNKRLHKHSIVPKKPSCAHALYIKSHDGLLKDLSREYTALSPEEQEKYVEMYWEDLARYYEEKFEYSNVVNHLNDLVDEQKKKK